MIWPAKKNANLGRDLEWAIQYQSDIYRRQGIAIVNKVPTEWIPLRDTDGKINGAKVERKSTVDFMGTARVMGKVISIAFDAKHTDRTGIRKDRVEPHQAQFLDEWDELTGHAYILAGFRMTDYYLVPWREWKQLPGTVKKENLLTIWRAGERGGMPKYLAVVERLMLGR